MPRFSRPLFRANGLLIRTEWFCPMHPDIVRSEPGQCSKCRMTLEPRVRPAEEPEKAAEIARARLGEAEMLCPMCSAKIETGFGDVHDPVCGMNVMKETPHRTMYKDKEYLFCSSGCLAKFLEDPDRYSKAVGLQ